MPTEYIALTKNNEASKRIIKINEAEALAKQYELLSSWEPASDVWSLKWGRAVLATSTIFSSLYYLSHYRRKLKLFNFGRIIMLFPGAVIPSIIVPILHQKLVLDPIFLEPQCPVCLQLRSAAIQVMFSVPYPIFVNSISSFMITNTYATYKLPTFSFTMSSLNEFFRLWKKLSKPLFSSLPFHILAQLVVSLAVTEVEARSFFKIQEQLIQKLKSSKS